MHKRRAFIGDIDSLIVIVANPELDLLQLHIVRGEILRRLELRQLALARLQLRSGVAVDEFCDVPIILLVSRVRAARFAPGSLGAGINDALERIERIDSIEIGGAMTPCSAALLAFPTSGHPLLSPSTFAPASHGRAFDVVRTRES